MAVTADARGFFTERHGAYDRFIRLMRYSQGLRAYFLASPFLRPGIRILDAGCGTGALTLAVHGACAGRQMPPACLHAFDLTPAMLARLRGVLDRRGIEGVALAEANVLQLEQLPADWQGYDLIVSASMLEYVPRERLADALRGLRDRLAANGRLVLFMTRRNPLTRVMIGYWWRSNLYRAAELAAAFRQAGFSRFSFGTFPLSVRQMALWGIIMEAER